MEKKEKRSFFIRATHEKSKQEFNEWKEDYFKQHGEKPNIETCKKIMKQICENNARAAKRKMVAWTFVGLLGISNFGTYKLTAIDGVKRLNGDNGDVIDINDEDRNDKYEVFINDIKVNRDELENPINKQIEENVKAEIENNQTGDEYLETAKKIYADYYNSTHNIKTNPQNITFYKKRFNNKLTYIKDSNRNPIGVRQIHGDDEINIANNDDSAVLYISIKDVAENTISEAFFNKANSEEFYKVYDEAEAKTAKMPSSLQNKALLVATYGCDIKVALDNYESTLKHSKEKNMIDAASRYYKEKVSYNNHEVSNNINQLNEGYETKLDIHDSGKGIDD